IQLLVMVIYLVLEIILDVPGRKDDGLAHQEKEDAADEREEQHQRPEEQQAIAENLIDQLLSLEPVEEPVYTNVFLDQVEGNADYLRGQYTEIIGYDNED